MVASYTLFHIIIIFGASYSKLLTMWKNKSQIGLLVSLTVLYITAFTILEGEQDKRVVRARIGEQKGHILTLNYTGQQAAGIRGLFSQQCWAKDFHLPMTIVTPFVKNSKLQHSQDVWNRHELVSTFDDYYDNVHFNKETRMIGNPVLTPWKQFIETGSRNLIVVTIHNIHARGCLVYSRKEMCYRLNVSDMLRYDCPMRKGTIKALEHLNKMGFQVQRKVCLDCSVGLNQRATPKEVVEHIFGEYRPQDVTVLIDQWKFSMRMSPTCFNKCPTDGQMLKQTIKPSQTLGYNAVSYVNALSNNLFPNSSPQLTVGIMIRLEWILIGSAHKQEQVVRSCLKEILLKYDSLEDSMGRKTTKKLPLLALDIGEYGSTTFENSMRIHKISKEGFNIVSAMVEDFVSTMYQDKLTFKEWEKTYTMLNKEDGGYIAYLQNTLVGESDCLLLMGGGHFQELAVDHYMTTHSSNKTCIHSFCTS